MARHLWKERILADGMTAEEVLAEYPQLAPEDVRAALEYAAEITPGGVRVRRA